MQGKNVFVDGHVHIYDKRNCGAILDAASENLRSAASEGETTPDSGVLMLADPVGVDGFAWFSEFDEPSGWRLASRPDHQSLHFQKEGALPLTVVAGHQAITSENLEVLIFPKTDLEENRIPLLETLRLATSAGALPVVPWGAGKWMGRRARIISDMLESQPAESVCVGDNGGRPVFPRHVALLQRACTMGFAEISGTDPLPLAGEEHRIGSYGSCLRADIDGQSTASDIILALRNEPLAPIGRRVSFGKFISNQLALRLR